MKRKHWKAYRRRGKKGSKSRYKKKRGKTEEGRGRETRVNRTCSVKQTHSSCVSLKLT